MISNALIRAPRILLLVAMLMLILGLGTAIVSMFEHDAFGERGWMRLVFLLQAIYQSVSGAALPFFGAALLWRIDTKWFDKKPSSEAAE
jgi:hypothetical protein